MNYTSYSVALFPADFRELSEAQIKKICARVRETTLVNGPCLYSWNQAENCLHVLYVSKNVASCFYEEDILADFHYWQISGDEGYANDRILGHSRFYRGSSLGEYVAPNWKDLDYWEYASNCFYQVDNIRISGLNHDFPDLMQEIFSTEYEPKIETRNLVFEKRMKMVYLSCNDRLSIEDLGYENLEFDIPSHLFDGGGLHAFISNNSYGRTQNEDFLQRIFVPDNSAVKSVELLFQERIVHQITWNPETKRWRRKSSDFWDNCMDSAYLRFSEWYRQQKAIHHS
ncbi:MAG: hypothetical protein AAF587_38770 [Bacteroidota bacterium]